MGWAARDGMGVKSSSSYYINNRQPKELELLDLMCVKSAPESSRA